jgi:hypothetical protein
LVQRTAREFSYALDCVDSRTVVTLQPARQAACVQEVIREAQNKLIDVSLA